MSTNATGFRAMNLIASKSALVVLAVLLASVVANAAAMLSYAPWIDEAIIADISYGYFKGEAYQHQNFILSEAAEGRIYGPVFFYLQNLFLHALGDSPFAFRITSAVAGYLLIGVVALLLQLHTRNNKLALWLAFVLLVSARLSSSAVSGRMDLVATLFAMSSLLCAWHYQRGSLQALLGCALLASLAYLTTPRALFLLPATLVMLMYCISDHCADATSTRRIVSHFLYAAAVFLAPIGVWVMAVGGLWEYSRLFLKPEMAEFIGPTIIRDWRDWIYLPALLVVIALNWRRVFADRLAVACCATFVIFSLCVHEVGPYKAMRLPYTFLLGALAVSLIATRNRKLLVTGLWAVIVAAVSVSAFAVRVLDSFYANRDCRDAGDFNQRMLANVPMHLSFLADYSFYYLLKGRPVTFSPLEIESPDFFVKQTLPDRILLDAETLKTVAQDGSPLHDILAAEYEVAANYSCPLHGSVLRERFENRHNFRNARLYQKKSNAVSATLQ